jgi:hypothetical protein
MSDLEPTTRALLSASRSADQPSDEAVARVERSLMLKIAAGASASVAIGAASTKAAGASLAAKLGGGALALALVAGGIALSQQPSAPKSEGARAPQAATSAVPATLQPGPAAPAPATIPPQAPAAGERAAAERATTKREPVKPESPALKLKAEAALIGEAQRALGAGRAAEALERLAQYDQRFPGGALRGEADATRVFALCQSGRLREGEAMKQAFLRRYPASPAAPRVRSACAAKQ